MELTRGTLVAVALVAIAPGAPVTGTPSTQALDADAGTTATTNAGFTLQSRDSGTDQLLQAVSITDPQTIWVSGHGGTWGRSLNGGRTWRTEVMAGAEDLQFRDVHALDQQTAWLMSAGTGDASRIYRTDDGGASWRLQYRNPEPQGFLDCFAFWDGERAVAFSDSVEGQTILLRTQDGGLHWSRLDPAAVPPALPGEGSFAASGTCVTAGPGGRAWVATGAGPAARILLTLDWGATWTAISTPATSGPMSGLASVLFRNADEGIAMGGNIGDPGARVDNVILSQDGGNTWRLGASPTFGGAVYGGAWVPVSREIVAVGPGGIAYSVDDAASWQALSSTPHWAVDFAADRVGWAVGPEGRITQLTPLPTPREATRTGQGAGPATITPDKLLQRLNADDELLVLDVRTAAEFAAGHVPGAINIPHTEIADRLAEVRKAGDVDIVVYCRSGRRAGIAEQILGRAGIGRLFDLQGHMSGWLERELPVQRGGSEKLPGGGL